MKFTAKLFAPRINVEAYRKALDRHMTETVMHGASAWLQAVLVEIPVWSGASHATFSKLAAAIGQGFGIAGERSGEGLAQSTGEVQSARGRYVFTYSTTLPWLIWNEYHNANVDPDPTLFYRLLQPGPYNFQRKGAEAFERFAETVQLLPVAPFVKSYPVK